MLLIVRKYTTIIVYLHAFIFTEETNKHCLQNLLWYLIKSDSSDVEVSGEEDEDSCSIVCLFLTRYFNTSFFISSFSLISSLVDFPFLLFFDFFFLDFSHFLAKFLAQWSLTSSSSWTATKDRDEEGLDCKASPGTMLDLEGHHYSHLHLMPWVEHQLHNSSSVASVLVDLTG